MIRDLGSRILTKAGYKVITASNGKEALELYRDAEREDFTGYPRSHNAGDGR